MSLDSSYARLAGDVHLKNRLQLRMLGDYNYKFPTQAERQYAYVEIPVLELINTSEDGGPVTEGKRNQYIRVVPACITNVKGNYRWEVHPNPSLNKYGIVQAPYYLESGEGEVQPSFHIWLRRDLPLGEIDYAVRIYMRK